jgi:hypothetical protein
MYKSKSDELLIFNCRTINGFTYVVTHSFIDSYIQAHFSNYSISTLLLLHDSIEGLIDPFRNLTIGSNKKDLFPPFSFIISKYRFILYVTIFLVLLHLYFGTLLTLEWVVSRLDYNAYPQQSEIIIGAIKAISEFILFTQLITLK